MTKFKLEFNTEMFIASWRPTMIKYFKGEVTAAEAAKYLGMPPGSWKGVMSNIFSEALRAGQYGKITEID